MLRLRLGPTLIAQPRRGRRHLQAASLRFNRMLLWLMVEIAQHYQLLQGIAVYHDLDKIAYEFGIIFND
jgi:hypothetical protein